MWRSSPSLHLAGWLSHLPSHPAGVLLSGDVSRTLGSMEWTIPNTSRSTKNLHRRGNPETRKQKRQPKGNKGNLSWQWHLNHTVQLPSFTFQSSPQSRTHTQHFQETWVTKCHQTPKKWQGRRPNKLMNKHTAEEGKAMQEHINSFRAIIESLTFVKPNRGS